MSFDAGHGHGVTNHLRGLAARGAQGKIHVEGAEDLAADQAGQLKALAGKLFVGVVAPRVEL